METLSVLCEKTVYLVEQLSANSKVYLTRPVLDAIIAKELSRRYCKPHFDQLLKMTESFEGAPRTARIDISIEPAPTNSKISSLFSGTHDKCIACNKKVYLLEKVAVDGNSYHKACFKCRHGGCVISPSSYIAHEHRLYCRHHHTQLFKQKGNFSKLDRYKQHIIGTA